MNIFSIPLQRTSAIMALVYGILLSEVQAKNTSDAAADLMSLYEAVQKGRNDVIEHYVGNEMDLNRKDSYGFTALHWASYSGNDKAINTLLKGNVKVNVVDKGNNTPLHVAAKAGHLNIVQLLVKHGANTTMQNSNGQTPSQLAKNANHQEVVTYLDNSQNHEQSARR